jgi:hypothetical protein
MRLIWQSPKMYFNWGLFLKVGKRRWRVIGWN